MNGLHPFDYSYLALSMNGYNRPSDRANCTIIAKLIGMFKQSLRIISVFGVIEMEYPKLAQKEQAKKYHFYPTVVFHHEALR
ncbi:MAG TPA: hypothetical protein DE042_05430 [Colwellia sp.]|nr:hypothetical protein [Colwellia sp.]